MYDCAGGVASCDLCSSVSISRESQSDTESSLESVSCCIHWLYKGGGVCPPPFQSQNTKAAGGFQMVC